jgi:hypothetical protein
MTEVDGEGLFLIEDDEVTHIHTTTGETNLLKLKSYLKKWDLLEIFNND